MCECISYSFIGFGFCSVLGKTAVLVRFVVTGFGFFLISRRNVILSLRLRAVDLLLGPATPSGFFSPYRTNTSSHRVAGSISHKKNCGLAWSQLPRPYGPVV